MSNEKPSACQGCQNCDGPACGARQIAEPTRTKPSMSMHVSVEDYKADVAKWYAEQAQRADDAAVDALAAAMKAKLAKKRAQGFGGWNDDCTQGRLSELLRGHVDKGDPVDVANFCAFLLARGEGIAPAPIKLAADRAGTVYVSGPMTGIEQLNFPAFNAAADQLRAQGYHVTNPADHGEVPGAEWADYLRKDVADLAACETIHLLPGWSKSKGARLELQVAQALGLQITYAEGAETVEAVAAQQGVPGGFVLVPKRVTQTADHGERQP